MRFVYLLQTVERYFFTPHSHNLGTLFCTALYLSLSVSQSDNILWMHNSSCCWRCCGKRSPSFSFVDIAPGVQSAGNAAQMLVRLGDLISFAAKCADFQCTCTTIDSPLQNSAKRRAPGCVRSGRSGKHQQEQNSPNLGSTFKPSPVFCRNLSSLHFKD